jgi:hypothetical protein
MIAGPEGGPSSDMQRYYTRVKPASRHRASRIEMDLMEHTRFVGLNIHKERISIAAVASGRPGAVEHLGEISNDRGAISKLCDCLRRYEARCAVNGVHRQLTSLGHRCDVVTPSLIPTKLGDRVARDIFSVMSFLPKHENRRAVRQQEIAINSILPLG